MIEILRKVKDLAITPVSDGADKQNNILCKELPFKILHYETGREHNGWVIPDKWEVIKAEIRKKGKVIYDGKKHPLGVIGYSGSFTGRLKLNELKKHLFYKKDAPNNIVYHCDLYYKPFIKLWGFSVPCNLYNHLEEGSYDVTLKTKHSKGTMKVLEYTLKGQSEETIIINAHNCHAAQLNDGPSGYVVGIEVMKRLKKLNPRYTYKLIIAPEHIGTVFYLADLDPGVRRNYKYCIFLEMLGHDNPNLALQETFKGDTELDKAAHHYLKNKNPNYYGDKFRKIVGNDETVWEAAGIEIPTISLSRCKPNGDYYPQYHLDSDNMDIIKEDNLNQSVDAVMGIIKILENNMNIKRKFEGLIALSNPKYDLYMRTNDPSIPIQITADQKNWNYLMDCLPRYFDEKMRILDIARTHDVFFDELLEYLLNFKKKGLIEFVDPLTKSATDAKIPGKRVYLRELTPKNASKEYCAWLNDSEVNKYLETRKCNIPELKRYIQKQLDDPNSFFVGIFDKKNNKHIGNIKLEPIDWKNKKAVFGILIGNKDYWGKGIGTEATKLIVDYAFKDMNLNEIELGVISENKAAIKVYEKVGFKVIDIKKNAVNHDGVLFDDVIMVIKK